MAKAFYIVSMQVPGLEWRITELNKQTLKATIVGDTGVPFVVSVKPEDLAEVHHRLDIREVDDASVHSQSAAA